MLRKFNKLPIVGSFLALLMFCVAVCFGYGVELYRFGIIIPVAIVCVFIWSLTVELKAAPTAFRNWFLVITGTIIAAVAGLGLFLYGLGEGIDADARKNQAEREAATKAQTTKNPDLRKREEFLNALYEKPTKK